MESPPPSGSRSGLETLLGRNPNFADPSGLLGYVHSFSFGIQKQFPRQISVEAAYVGSRTIGVPTTVGFQRDLTRRAWRLAIVRRAEIRTILNERVPNPFEGLLPGTSINSSTVPRQQLLRPFPQFTSFNAAWIYQMAKFGTTRFKSP